LCPRFPQLRHECCGRCVFPLWLVVVVGHCFPQLHGHLPQLHRGCCGHCVLLLRLVVAVGGYFPQFCHRFPRLCIMVVAVVSVVRWLFPFPLLVFSFVWQIVFAVVKVAASVIHCTCPNSCNESAVSNCSSCCNGSCSGKRETTAIAIEKQTMVMATDMASAKAHLVMNQLLLVTAAATYPAKISCNELAISNHCSAVAIATASAKNKKQMTVMAINTAPQKANGLAAAICNSSCNRVRNNYGNELTVENHRSYYNGSLKRKEKRTNDNDGYDMTMLSNKQQTLCCCCCLAVSISFLSLSQGLSPLLILTLTTYIP